MSPGGPVGVSHYIRIPLDNRRRWHLTGQAWGTTRRSGIAGTRGDGGRPRLVAHPRPPAPPPLRHLRRDRRLRRGLHALIYLIEHRARTPKSTTLFDSFLFSASQLLTGSSVANPRTDLGKVLELIFDLWAITVVASFAGSFGAFFHARSKELNEEMERAEALL